MNESKDKNNPLDFTLLPGFAEAKERIESKGLLADWLYSIVDKSDSYAAFVKGGKPWYKSECPYYEGYWLLGGTGSVQCRLLSTLLPGYHWQKTCRENHVQCPLYKAE